MKPPVPNRDLILLSQYLDQRLDPAQRARLEARLSQEADLRETLESLRKTRLVLRSLPRARAPRNFTLSAQRSPARVSPLVPYLSWASAVATLLLALVVMGDWFGFWLQPRLARPAAPAVSYSQEIAVETQITQPEALMAPSALAIPTELVGLAEDTTARSSEVQPAVPTDVVSAPASAESAQMKDAPQAESEAFKLAPAVTMSEPPSGLGVSPVVSGTETMTTTVILEMEAPIVLPSATPLAQAALPTASAPEGAYEEGEQVKAEDQAAKAVSTPPAVAGEEAFSQAPVETSASQVPVERWILWIIEVVLLLIALAAALAVLILRRKSAR